MYSFDNLSSSLGSISSALALPVSRGRHGKLVDNFSHKSDVTSIQDPFTSRPYKTPFHFYYCVPRKIRRGILFQIHVEYSPSSRLLVSTLAVYATAFRPMFPSSFKVGYHDHVWTVSSQREYESQSTLNSSLYDNLVNRCGWWSSSHTSPLSETRHVSGCSFIENISYQFMSDITCRFMCIFFFVQCLQQRAETNGEVVYTNRTWVQAKMPTTAAGDCQ